MTVCSRMTLLFLKNTLFTEMKPASQGMPNAMQTLSWPSLANSPHLFFSFWPPGIFHHVPSPPFTGDAAARNLERPLQSLVGHSHTQHNKIITVKGPTFWLTSMGLANPQAQRKKVLHLIGLKKPILQSAASCPLLFHWKIIKRL